MGRKGIVKLLDFYRKVPQDLTESTTLGKALSIFTVIFIGILFGAELIAFIKSEAETSLVLDPNDDLKLRININITMLELPCEYAAIDLYDVLGTSKLNYTKNILKWNTGATGEKNVFHGRDTEAKEIAHDDHHNIQELELNGVDAEQVNAARFEDLINGNKVVMAAFIVPWCVWCQRLTPTWEALSEEVARQELKVPIIKIDCMEERTLCANQKIHAFPTLRLFKDGAGHIDYTQDRTVESLVAFIKDQAGEAEKPPEAQKALTPGKYVMPNEHIGCQISGFLLVNRVPGNFHIEPRSPVHSFNAPMTNLSHVIHSLHFGHRVRPRKDLPQDIQSNLLGGLNHIYDHVHITEEDHQSPHHYIEVVSTYYEQTFFSRRTRKDYNQYQMVKQDQLVKYDVDEIPEAMFKYDLSPVAVLVKKPKRRWYQFITSLLAILGGTFTTVGILNMILLTIFKPKKA